MAKVSKEEQEELKRLADQERAKHGLDKNVVHRRTQGPLDQDGAAKNSTTARQHPGHERS